MSSRVESRVSCVTAIGCPVLSPPRDGWLEQVGQDVLVGCNSTKEKWYLRCNGRNWIGQMRNCSALGMTAEGEWRGWQGRGGEGQGGAGRGGVERGRAEQAGAGWGGAGWDRIGRGGVG